MLARCLWQYALAIGRAERQELGKTPQDGSPAAAPDADRGEAGLELLGLLDSTTRQALERVEEMTASTSRLIAEMTRDAMSMQTEAMERTAAAAERLLRASTDVTRAAAAEKPAAPARAPRRRPRKS
tara:strand:+ start:217 stop:597 length:381 start_codon:yes stop_codon:yes gene_type:complete